jgi:hypothetical protein
MTTASSGAAESPRRFWLWFRHVLGWPLRHWPFRQFYAPGPLSGRERQGYIVWGLVASVIGAVEILGAVSSSLKNSIPWPTISSTVGHLEARWSFVAVLVVALITVAAFFAVAYREKVANAMSDATPPQDQGFSGEGLVYDLCALAVVGVAATVVATHGATKFQLGDTIYGLLATFCIVIPSIWTAFTRREPTLLSTVRSLRTRIPWVTIVILCGLTILAVHLAFYPWPDIPHE